MPNSKAMSKHPRSTHKNHPATRRLVSLPACRGPKCRTKYTYDSVGNVLTVDYPTSTDLTFKYDANNRLTNMLDAVGTTALAYTGFGALKSEDGPWTSDTVSLTYAMNGLRSSLGITQPTGPNWSQTYAYDSAERLTNIVSAAGNFAYKYDPNHLQLVQKLTLPNSSVITNDYDSVARLLRTHLRNNAGTSINQHEYLMNLGGLRTNQMRLEGTSATGVNIGYLYDSAGRLVYATGKDAWTTNRSNEQFLYAYDAAGNLTTRTNNALIQTFNVNTLNQLTTITRSGTLTVAGTTTTPATNVTVNTSTASLYADKTFAKTGFSLVDGNNTFTAVAKDVLGRQDTQSITYNLPATVTFFYDAKGNLTYDGNRAFVYDDENQLIRVTQTNNWKSEFVYDGQMRRRITKEYTWSSGSWLQTNEVHYVYDGNLVVQERDLNNAPVVSLTRGKDLSGSLSGAGGIGGLLARTEFASQTHSYFHSDGNGNVTVLIDANQLIAARYTYDPYGNILSMSGRLAGGNLYRWSSKEAHPNSGLVYYLYRFYDSNLQRWLNRDPLGEPGFEDLRGRTARVRGDGPNYYAFVRNNPQNRVDPRGLAWASFDCTAILMRAASLEIAAASDPWNAEELQRQADDLYGLYFRFCTPPPPPPEYCPVRIPNPSDDPYRNNRCAPGTVEAAVGIGVGYVIYRCIRMIPSLFPPLWPTIPANAVIP